MKMDRKLISRQPHEIRYLLKAWNITRKELLEILETIHTTSRGRVEQELKEMGYEKK